MQASIIRPWARGGHVLFGQLCFEFGRFQELRAAELCHVSLMPVGDTECIARTIEPADGPASLL